MARIKSSTTLVQTGIGKDILALAKTCVASLQTHINMKEREKTENWLAKQRISATTRGEDSELC
jgi:hypothetical protein